MRINIFIIILFITGLTNLSSQNSNYDINILIKKDFKTLKITNDSLSYQKFILKERINYLKKVISFNKKGILETKLKITNSNKDNQLIFVYKNKKNINPPIVRRKNECKNLLRYPEDFENIKIEKLRKLLNNSKNIFIIESDTTIDYYLLKKVSLSKKLSNL